MSSATRPDKPMRLAVLISGSGRTLKNFIDLAADDELPIDIRLVVSSSAKAGGLEFAKAANIPTAIVLRGDFATGPAGDTAATHVFLCGNPKMIGVPHRDRETGATSYPSPVGVIEVLEGRGFKADVAATKFKGNIHFEEYW